MLKLILPIVGIILAFVFVVWRFSPYFNSSTPKTQSISPVTSAPSVKPESDVIIPMMTPLPSILPGDDDQDSAIVRRINDLSENVSQIALLQSKVAKLESDNDDLKKRVAKLEQAPTVVQSSAAPVVTISSNQSRPVTYIPFVSSGSSAATDWTDVIGQDIVINTDDYPGYTAMYLEASLQCFQGNGAAYARIKTTDDGTSILSSQLNTTSENYTYVTSTSFKLPSGKKTYRIQLKTLTGYAASIQNARIKVVF